MATFKNELKSISDKINKAIEKAGYECLSDVQAFYDGKPCGHKGCLNHISHPCEGCGRIGGRGL